MSDERYLQWATTPNTNPPTLSVVLPAYNETERIISTIASIVAHLSIAGIPFEIIVSDDGSRDGTPDVVRRLGLANVVVLDPGKNKGKGAAVRAGMRAARGQFVLFSDADLSTPIQEIDKLLEAAQHSDVVIGSRAVEGATETEKCRLRCLLSWGARRMTRLALGVAVSDTQCGFKLFRREAAQRLFAAQQVDGFSFDAEILFLARRFGYRITELPVEWVDAPGSKVRPLQVALKFLVDLGKIRLAALCGSYPKSACTQPSTPGGLRLALVTALPPSTATLNEYGLHLARRLGENPGVDHLVVLADDRDGLPEVTDAYDVVPAWRFDSPTSLLRLWRAVREQQPDVVFFNAHFTSFGTRKVPAALGLLAPAMLRLQGVRTMVLLHNLVDTVDLDAAGYGHGKLINRALTGIGRTLTRVVLRADWVSTTMPAYVDVLHDRYRATNVSHTPHGTFETPVSPSLDPTDGRRRVLAFGKFGSYKKVEDLIEAFRMLQERGGYGDAELVIAGTDGPTTPGYLARVAATHPDVPNIRYTGYVPEDDVAAVFGSASLVVFPYTATTGSSGPLHQAGAYARAVVAPRLGDLLELIEHEGFAVQPFTPGDPANLADAIATVLDDDELRHRLGRANQQAAGGLPLATVCELHVERARHLAGLPTAAVGIDLRDHGATQGRVAGVGGVTAATIETDGRKNRALAAVR